MRAIVRHYPAQSDRRQGFRRPWCSGWRKWRVFAGGWCKARLGLCWCFILRWRARCEHRSSTRWPQLPCCWAQRSSSHHVRRRCSRPDPPVSIRLFTKQRPRNKCVLYAGEGHMVVDATIFRGRMLGTCDPMPAGALNGITHIILITGVVG